MSAQHLKVEAGSKLFRQLAAKLQEYQLRIEMAAPNTDPYRMAREQAKVLILTQLIGLPGQVLDRQDVEVLLDTYPELAKTCRAWTDQGRYSVQSAWNIIAEYVNYGGAYLHGGTGLPLE